MTSLGLAAGVSFSRKNKGILASLGAVFAIDARNSSVGEQSVLNLGSGGAALNARYGSTTSSDTNDPTFFQHAGINYWQTAPTFGNGELSTPHQASYLHAGGDIIFSARLFNQAYVSSDVSIIERSGTASLILNTTGRLTPYMWDSISVKFPTASSSLPVGFTGWVEWRVNITSGVGSYWSAPDSTTYPTTGWTSLGSHAAPASWTGSFPDPAVTLNVGYSTNITSTAANIAAARYAVSGAQQLLISFENLNGSESSFVCSTGQTITINRGSVGKKGCLVTRSSWIFGADDSFQVPDNSLLNFSSSENFTALIVLRQWPTTGGHSFIQKTSTTGWELRHAGAVGTYGSAVSINDGTNSVTAFGSTDRIPGNIELAYGRRDSSIPNVNVGRAPGQVPVDGVTSTATVTGTLSNTVSMLIGSTLDAEVFAVALFRRLLTNAELSAIAREYRVT